MARETYAETANYTIETDDDLDAIVHTWKAFTSGQTFRDGSNELLEAIRETGCPNLIVDTSNIQAHDDEDKQWLRDQWTPKALDAGMEAGVVVYSNSVISEVEMENFEADLEDFPHDTFVTGDLSEAKEWVANQ